MSGMPGWSQDSIACHRMEIQKAPHCNFTGQIRGKQENCSKFAPKILWCSILCSRFRALLTCIPSGCCTKEGLSKVAQEMTEGQIVTVCLLKKLSAFGSTRSNLIISFLCLSM